jgi:hypothetical protein
MTMLYSYYYLKKEVMEIMEESQAYADYMIDSGAYTAFSLGKEIKREEYQNFLRGLKFKPFKYFMLDVIGDEKGTMENLKLMRQDGFDPVPIFTRGSNVELIDELYNDTDLIGLGGISARKGNSRTRTYGYVKMLMKKVAERKCHWLGFAILNFIKYYKPYSLDSTSWSSGLQYGSIPIWFQGKEYRISRDMFMKRPTPFLKMIHDYYEEDISRAQYKEQWRHIPGRYMNAMSAKASVKKSIEIEQKLGTKFFISCSTAIQLKDAISAYKFWKGKANV